MRRESSGVTKLDSHEVRFARARSRTPSFGQVPGAPGRGPERSEPSETQPGLSEMQRHDHVGLDERPLGQD